MNKQCHSNETNVSTGQLGTFLNAKGPIRGAGSPAYYAAYVLFEKMRLQTKKPKSKKREEMEQEWGSSGVDRSGDGSFFCRPGERPYVDKFGKVRFG